MKGTCADKTRGGRKGYRVRSITYWWACKNYVLRWEYGY